MNGDDDPAAEIHRLRAEIGALRRRVATLEEAVETESTAADPARSDESRSQEPGALTAGADEAEPNADRDRRQAENWERNVGIKWLGLIGGLALVVGVVLFVRLAIDAGLLGPLGRVLVGTLGGLALVGGGRFAAERQGYVRWGHITAGVGLAISYFSLYAAYGFDSYRAALGTPLWLVLLAMTVLVAGAVVTTVRDRSPAVAGEAFLLGYVTAYLGLDAGTFIVTPVYALLLAVGLVIIASVRPWSRLVAASVLPTYGIIWAWNADVDPVPPLVVGVVLAAFGTYLAGDYVLRSDDATGRWARFLVPASTVLNAGGAAVLLEVTTRAWFPDLAAEGVAVGAIGVALLGVYAGTAHRPVRRNETAGTLAVVLVAGSVVLSAGTFVSTVGLLAVVCGAVAVASRYGAGAFRTGAHLVAGGAVGKLLVVDARTLPAFDSTDPVAAATGRAAAFVVGIVAFYGLAWWFRTEQRPVPWIETDRPLAAPYGWAGTGLAVVVLGLELSGVGVSVAWAVLGLVLVGVGLTTDVRGLRLQGVAVLGLVTVKVFLADTRDLALLARTLSFLVLGGILLATSYAYARWQGGDPLSRVTDE